jgi:protein-disulfide isomerase
MLTNRRIFTVAALAAATALTACGGGGGSTDASRGNFERADDRAKGVATAPVTLVEYASVACAHCRDFHENVYPMLNDEFVETGQVRFVFREMITGSAPLAVAGFMLARCAPDDRYFDMIELLFDQQVSIFQSAQRPGGAREEFRSIARAIGMNDTEFNACLANENLSQDVRDAHQQAIDDGIDATPRFIINGELLESRRGDGGLIYTWDGEPIMIDGEPLPALVDEDTFRQLMTYFVAQNTQSAASDGETAPDEG